tara:strand:- start:122393 stop:130243 length:7851 start_codon:yes stop_codon:yes gene_type:complete
MRKNHSVEIKTNRNKSEILRKSKTLKQSSILLAVLPLAACGGGGGGATPAANTPAPAPTPDPDFTESPTNVFIALDDSGRTLSEGGNAANLTVTGKAGNDSITTGSGADTIIGAAGNDTIISNDGNDLIRAGEGRDTVSAGSGNDAIVVVGTTSAGQYTNTDITNPAGSGTNLSNLVSLADLNGRSVSEVVSGESIDGGTGTNTLFIYGTVDLTGVTLNNITVLVVNSDVTLTAEQMVLFTTVDGDGTSTINIEVPPGDTYIIDLSTLNLTDIGSLNVAGDVTFVVDDASDFDEIGAVSTETEANVSVEINGSGANTTVNLGDIADKIDNVDVIDVAPDVTLEIDDANDVTSLGLDEITGGGDVETGGDPDIADALDDVEVAEEVEVILPTLSISDGANYEETEYAAFTITLSQAWQSDVTVNYTLQNGQNYSATIVAGQTEMIVYVGWADDLIEEADEILNVTLSNPTNATILDGTGILTIFDDDTPVNVNGTDGDDEYSTSADIENFNTGSGNDIITINPGDGSAIEDSFDGGEGYDKLVFEGSGHDIDLSQLDFSNIYVIDISGDGANSVLIDHQTAQDVGYENLASLRITGNSDDSVTTSESWNYFTSGVSDGVLYNIFEFDDYDTMLYIDAEIGNVNGFPAVPPTFNETSPNTFESTNYSGSFFSDRYSTDDLNITFLTGGGYVVTGSGNDTINGSNHAEAIYSYGGDDIINAGGGNDYVVGGLGADTLDGGSGRDTLSYLWSNEGVNVNLSTNQASGGDAEGDTISNFEEVVGSNYDDTITGADFGGGLFENSRLYGGNGNDTITGGEGHDYIAGGSGDDIINGGDGGDYIEGNAGADIMNGGAGGDTFEIGSEDDADLDQINGGEGEDKILLIGEQNNPASAYDLGTMDISNIEVIYFDRSVDLTLSAQDVIDATDQNNQLEIQVNSDVTLNTSSTWSYNGSVIKGSALYNSYSSGDATLLLYAQGSEPTLNGFPPVIGAFEQTGTLQYEAVSDDDSIFDGSEHDSNMTISGKAGNDVLIGGTSNDTINGGAGNDTISGGSGVDAINGDIGDDTLIATSSTGSFEEDSFDGGDGWDILSVSGDDTVTPVIFDLADLSGSNLEEIVLSDGNAETLIVSAADIIGIAKEATPGYTNDYYFFDITGYNEDTIELSAEFTFDRSTVFNDQVYQIYEAFTGDYSTGYDAAVVYVSMSFGTINNATTPGVTYLETAPDQWEAQDPSLSALNVPESENDLTIIGNDGSDTIATGSGDDTINTGNGSNWVTPGAGDDTVIGGSGYDSFRGSVGSDYYDGGAGDTDYISYYNSEAAVTINLETGIHSGGRAQGDTIINIESVGGSKFDDTITGSATNEEFLGGDGDDTINGGGGHDNLYGGSGADILNGGDGDDLFSTSAYYNDKDEDTYDGGAGFDAFRFSTNSYPDQTQYELGDYSLSNIETLLIRNVSITINAQDVINVTDSDNTLFIGHYDINNSSLITTSTWVYVHDFVFDGALYHQYTSGDATLNISQRLPNLTGITLPATTFTETASNVYEADSQDNSSLELTGSYTGVTATGLAGDDIIIGSERDDTLNGGAGNDTIVGNRGTDTLNGGVGDDTFVIVEDTGSEIDDIIDGGTGSADTILLNGVNNGSDTGFNGVHESGNFEVDMANLNATNIEIIKLQNDVNLTFTAQNIIDFDNDFEAVWITGGSGSTVITSSSWTFLDYATLSGDTGGILYLAFESGTTKVYIDLEIGTWDGITKPANSYTESAPNVFDVIDSSADSYFSGRSSEENLTVNGGNASNYIVTGNGNDTVNGGDGVDLIYGQGGDDTINGGDGDDVISGGRGSDTLIGGADSNTGDQDTLTYSNSDKGVDLNVAAGIATVGSDTDTFSQFETYNGSNHDDIITGSANSFTYNGLGGDDTIIGGLGNEEIHGNDGDDIIEGGNGVDTLYGGDDNDTFIINQGDNSETEDSFDGGDGTNTLLITGNHAVTPFELSLSDFNADNINHIRLSDDMAESLEFSIQNVADFSSTINNIRIFGGANDTVSTLDSLDFGGVFLGAGHTMYSYSGIDDNGGYQVIFISMEIGTLNGFAAPTITGYTEGVANIYSADDDELSAFSDAYSTENLTINTGLGRSYITTGSGDDIININANDPDSSLTQSYIYSGAGDDTINGGDDRDYIRGSEGADTIDGGGHVSDTVSYYFLSTEGINVNLATGINTGGFAEGDILTNIEVINGTRFDDTITGDDNDNWLYGEQGDDILNGGGGNDTFNMGTGYNIVDGGTGDDLIYMSETYGSSDGIFDGGSDFDTFEFRSNDRDNTDSYVIDFSTLDLRNFEMLSLSGDSAEEAISVNIDADQLIDLTDSNNTFFIKSKDVQSYDYITVTTTSNWTYLAEEVRDSVVYSRYESGDAVLYIETAINTFNGFSTPSPTFTETSTDVWGAIDNSDSSFTSGSSSHTFTVTGKDGNDIINVREQGEHILSGGAGNDTIISSFGDLTMDGGSGNDTLYTLRAPGVDAYTRDIDGGTGEDTLIYQAYYQNSDIVIDLTEEGITNIEYLQLDTTTEVSLTVQDVLDVTDADNELILVGEGDDSVTSTGEGWVQGADQIVNSETYNTYTSGGATLLIDEDIIQDIS